MSIDFLKILAETKGQLKGMITKESSQEQIKVITELDKNLDSLNEAFQDKVKENDSLKDDLIASVKGTGFKVNGSSNDDSGATETQKSMEEIMEEELDKIVANQK